MKLKNRLFLCLLILFVTPNSVIAEEQDIYQTNINIIQESLEIYANKTSGVYPAEISTTLLAELNDVQRKKLLNLKNPITGEKLENQNIFTDYYIYKAFFPRIKFYGESTKLFSGLIIYQPLEFRKNEFSTERFEYKRYILYTTDKDGELVRINDKLYSVEKKEYNKNLDQPIDRDVKDNLETFKQILKNYLVASGIGFYPVSIEQLFNDASYKEYWRDIKNPFTEKIGKDYSLLDYSIYLKNTKRDLKGFILYQPYNCGKNDEGEFCRKYNIYGLDKSGNINIK